MNKRVLWALILIAATMIVLLFNRQSASVDVLFTEIHAMAALIYLFFIGLGVAIGLLLK
ncbi:MAG: hypothetical protein O3B24_08110 [Verrucomicrobia bacterium]|nr:hypothetical protein [Verrucomicrobiota bacterium]